MKNTKEAQDPRCFMSTPRVSLIGVLRFLFSSVKENPQVKNKKK